ncbi:hybrid sensor histidine kinase/response regulator [Bacteroidia bacterium]|nr:hybrid sensor histidine kinase/response regulator [Bacteroidia bacterium]
MKKIFICLLIATIGRTQLAAGGEYGIDITSIDNTDGLASNDVFAIARDNQKFIWTGTTNGLCRYDGYGFKVFKSSYSTPSLLQSNTIRKIACDRDDRLWMITSAGLEVMDLHYNRVTKYGLEFCDNASKIYDICVLPGGNIFLAVDNHIYEHIDGAFKIRASLPDKCDIRTLFADSRNVMWIGTMNNGIFSMDLEGSSIVPHRQMSGTIGKPTCFYEDSRHNLWVGSWREGLLKVEEPFGPNPRYKLSMNDNSLGSIITSVVEDDLCHYLWVGTYDGLKVITDKTAQHGHLTYNTDTHPELFASNEVRSIIKDDEGTIWMTTMGSGLKKAVVYRRHFDLLQPNSLDRSVVYNDINAVFLSPDSTLWLGVKMNLFAYIPKGQKLKKHDSSLPLRDYRAGQTVCDFLPLDGGDMWISTRYNGALSVRYGNGEITSAKIINKKSCPQLSNDHFFMARRDSRGNIWVGTQSGLELFTPKKDGGFALATTKRIREITADVVQAMLIDRGGNLWLGTEKNGMIEVALDKNGEPAGQRSFNVDNGLAPHNDIQCFFEDSHATIWAGSQGGAIASLDQNRERFSIVEAIYSLYTDAVFSINEDSRQNLWLGTDKGLLRYSPYATQKQVLLYNSKYDTGNASFTRGATFKTADGKMFFGSNLGLVSFYPESLDDKTSEPNTIITDILINGNPMEPSPENDRPSPSFMSNVRLSYKEYNITIKFSALTFYDAHAERYAYKMEGLDDHWRYTEGAKPMITYNLRKGSYRFMVKASLGNGGWGASTAVLSIRAAAAPWNSWWAYMSYTLMVLLFGLYYLRVYKKRTHLENMLRFEQLERQKSDEVNQVKLVFFTNVSHELFAPLTILSCSVDEFSEKSTDKALAPILKTMKANLSRLIRLTLQILEFRKAESGNLELRVSPGDLSEFIKKICDDNFGILSQNKNISLGFTSEPGAIQGWFDSDKVDKIVFNLLSNAVKYNYEGGKVNLRLSRRDTMAVIEVSDTGCGISKERLGGLFTRFYEGDYRKFNTFGTGIGLSLVKNLVDLHNGTISVTSQVGKGTVFTVELPCERGSYNETQIVDESAANAQQSPTDSALLNTNDLEAGEKFSILIVEDNDDLQQMLATYFEQSYDVRTAQNGRQALEMAHQFDFDIILTDYAMPEMDGVELCREIKSNLETSHIPVVLLTAKIHTEDKVTGFNAGADMYITKPFNFAELFAAVTAQCNNRRRIAHGYRRRSDGDEGFAFTPLDQSFLRKATDIVMDNIDNPEFTTEKFGRELNISQPTLYRKIKSLTGLSAHEFGRNLRMKYAGTLLLQYDKNISQVAYAVGYNNPKHFSSSFKKEMGMTPREWINSHQGEK